jgi:hypothetical protein
VPRCAGGARLEARRQPVSLLGYRTARRAVVVAICAAVALPSLLLARHDASRDVRPGLLGSDHGVAGAGPRLRPIVGAQPVVGIAGTRPAVPVRLRIPAIGVDTKLQRLGLEQDGSLQPPSRWGVAGWYAGGPRPGDIGPAVIAGHVDSTLGPAVFYSLREVRPGDRVFVTDRRGSVLRFVVDHVAAFPKTRFPTALVYGPQPLPVLRLITCTGAFDAAQRSYVENLVVSAHVG